MTALHTFLRDQLILPFDSVEIVVDNPSGADALHESFRKSQSHPSLGKMCGAGQEVPREAPSPLCHSSDANCPTIPSCQSPPDSGALKRTLKENPASPPMSLNAMVSKSTLPSSPVPLQLEHQKVHDCQLSSVDSDSSTNFSEITAMLDRILEMTQGRSMASQPQMRKLSLVDLQEAGDSSI